MKYISIIILILLSFIGLGQPVNSDTVVKKTTRLVCYYYCSQVSAEDIKTNCNSMMTRSLNYYDDKVSLAYTVFHSLEAQITKLVLNNPDKFIYVFNACDKICNAASLLNDEDQGVILFNPIFFQSNLTASESDKWKMLGVFAHEMGHLVMDHPNENRDKPNRTLRRNELRADFFAGYILSKMDGASTEKIVQSLQLIDTTRYQPSSPEQDIQGDFDYPALSFRRDAMILGYNGNIRDSFKIEDFDKKAIDDVVNAKGYRLLFRTFEDKLLAKDYNKAIRLIDNYLKDNPDAKNKSELLNLRGIAQSKAGKAEKAARSFDEAVKTSNSNDNARLNKAQIENDEIKIKELEKIKKMIVKPKSKVD